LAQLVRAELIFRRGTPPDAEYTFKHALVQDAAYSTLLRGRRQQFHARIAETLERQFPEIVASDPALLAQHCAEAGFNEKAVGYRLKAGEQAVARSAMTEAAAQLRKGLDLLSGPPDGAARREQELNLQITLGRALIATKGFGAPEPGEAFARAHQLCEQLGGSPQLGSVLTGQFVFRYCRAEFEQAQYVAAEMQHLGETGNDPIWKPLGHVYGGSACFQLGKLIDARTHYETALPLWDHPMARAAAATPEDPYVGSLAHFFLTLACLGYLDQARLRRDEAVAYARRQRSPPDLAFALAYAWYGDWAMEGVKSVPRMLRSADELLATSSEQGFTCGSGRGTSCAAGAWAERGNLRRASRCSSRDWPSGATRAREC
jgi:hypothetical protein